MFEHQVVNLSILDQEVARDVMDWGLTELPGGDDHWEKQDGRLIPVSQWNPSTNLLDAWLVVENLRNLGYDVDVRSARIVARWFVEVSEDDLATHGPSGTTIVGHSIL